MDERRPGRHALVKIKVFVEGGAFATPKSHLLNTECRKAFRRFFEEAGLAGKMPAVVVCGPRNNAYSKFCDAVSKDSDEFPMLLVDSETQVAVGSNAWGHLKHRDNWDKPANAADDHAHLMVQVMDAWIVVDPANLAKFYKQDFNAAALPDTAHRKIESVTKEDIYAMLENATKQTQKGAYNEGKHSFKLLETTNPELVKKASPFAEKLIDTLIKISSLQ